ncbi:hypothetical protein Pth03_18370 [Planotetraspora thailandica]|uniref:Uncharacterized protein n=1 Tax=Planotetraspora thailandica TaxID=487172 RepID=A0A8J3XXT7_9ACTN|nr:hypothetical protein [Planotetraspora thailandica]GII53448.1 hypothetical protein Pth03_18370 [Planotetraspora thailandica]
MFREGGAGFLDLPLEAYSEDDHEGLRTELIMVAAGVGPAERSAGPTRVH